MLDFELQDSVPPHSIEAEQAILCGLFQDPDCIHVLAGKLKPNHFYNYAHQLTYEACLALYNAQVPIDPVSVVEALKGHGHLENVGGVSYINGLFTNTPDVSITASNVLHWVDILLDYSDRRELIRFGHQCLEAAHDTSQNNYLAEAQSQMLKLSNRSTENEFKTLEAMVNKGLSSIQERLSNPDGVTGLESGFKSLDSKTSGFQPGQLIILGARSGTGKTAFGLNVALAGCLEQQQPVLFFSLEMTGSELMQRAIKTVSGSMHDLEKLAMAADRLKALEGCFLVDDRANLTIGDIQAKATQTKANHPTLGLVVVDYLGKVKPSTDGNRNTNRAYELEEVTWGLKILAKSLQVPVLALCQLNRAIETRQEKKPQLSDLRDSGAIEQDADIVLFLSKDDRKPTETILTIAKHRNGPLGEIPLCFVPHLTQFREMPSDCHKNQ